MDRLDAWLSAQRGWRLLLIRGVVLAPAGIGGGALWSADVTFDPATPQVHALVARMALCLAASSLLVHRKLPGQLVPRASSART